MTGIFVRDRRETDTEKAMRKEAERGMLQPQTKEHLETPVTGRGGTGPSPEPGKTVALLTA